VILGWWENVAFPEGILCKRRYPENPFFIEGGRGFPYRWKVPRLGIPFLPQTSRVSFPFFFFLIEEKPGLPWKKTDYP